MLSLSDTHPHLIQEWNCGKNSPLLPNEVTAGQRRKDDGFIRIDEDDDVMNEAGWKELK